MKNKIIFALAAVITACLLIFVGCSINSDEPKDNGETETKEVLQTVSTTEKKELTYEEKLKTIAFTFDDGPSVNHTPRVLDALSEFGYTATFFVVGQNVEGREAVLQQILDAGCEIGNHSWSHKNLSEVSLDTRNSQINRTNEAVKNAVGYDIRLLRAPYGDVAGIKGEVDMPLIQWSLDTEDWKKKKCAGDADEARALADYILENVECGTIVLMHDIYDFTAEVCELVMPELHERGYRVVSVSQMYEDFEKPLKGGTVYSHPSPDPNPQ